MNQTSGALQPLENLQRSERVYESLRAAIITGELPPGQQIRDRELAELLRVSRTPVREAMYRLQSAGLIVAKTRRWYVAPIRERDMRELFEVRRLFEPLGLDRLAKDPDPDTINELATFFDEFSPEIERERYQEYFECDHAFHKRLIALSGNRQVQHFYTVVEHHIDRGRHFLSTGYAGRVDANLEEHRAISEAVGTRDFDRAKQALDYHLRMGEELMLSFLNEMDLSE